jgi:hypothetical protein
MESSFHTLKTELAMQCDYQTREQAQSNLFEYVEVFYASKKEVFLWDNRRRRHSDAGL